MNRSDFKDELLSDPILFAKYFFYEEYNRNYYPGEHHLLIAEKLRNVLSGEITRLIINVFPRSGKTELVVKMFMAMGLAFNPKSKFIHTSYSEKLALDNSESVRDLIKSETFSNLFSIQTKKDSDSKSKWYTYHGGGIYATSTGGQITGFGAGSIDCPYFSGALIIDDPIKPEDAISTTVREFINQRFDNTLRSRLNSERTPIIIIMQRLHKNDLTGYLLDKEPETWDVLKLPALKSDNTSLWPEKLTPEHLQQIRKVNLFVFNSQYQQDPTEVQTGGEFYSEFDVSKHTGDVQYNSELPVHLSFDNNVLPYIAIGLWQINGDHAYQFDEIPAEEPNNTAIRSARLVIEYLKGLDYKDTLYIYGDQTSGNKNTIDENKKSFIDLFTSEIRKEFSISKKIPSSNPPVSLSGEFLNAVYGSNFMDLKITIGKNCIKSIEDYTNTKKDENGKVMKKKITDPVTKQSYEERGHYSDHKRYFLVQIWKTQFRKFKRFYSGDEDIPISAGGGSTDRSF